MAQASGTFTVASWDENTYAELEGGGKLTKARITFAFDRDLKAEGVWEAVMCYRPDGTASFTGFQQTVGELAGRKGSLVLRADGTYEGGEARSTWQVVDGTGTEELAGLRGFGVAVSSSAPGGTYTFDYELD